LAVLNTPAAQAAAGVASVLGAPLTVKSVSVDDNGVPTATLVGTPGKQYRLAGFLVTSVKVTITGTTPVTLSGSARIQVPLGGSTVSVPVTFSLANGVLSVDGTATVNNFRFGAEPAQVAAPSGKLEAHLDANLATAAVSGSVSASAANALLVPES